MHHFRLLSVLSVLFVLFVPSLGAVELLKDLQLSGTANQVQSGATMTVVSGGALTVATGGAFTFTGGTMVGTLAIANGGTGATTDSAARTALGLAIGTNVQAYDADLTTYAGITPSANIQTFLGAVDYAAIRTQLALTIGTDVQAYDADLTTYAGITPSANIQTFLGAVDYAAMRTQLALTIGTNVQAYDADLTTYAGITPSANIQTFLGAVDYAAIRTQLALTIGTDVQAYDADLTTYAGITPSANIQTFLGAADYAAMRTQLALTTHALLEDIANIIPSSSEALTYSSGGDTNGVVYRIGTNYGGEAFSNPHTSGQVVVVVGTYGSGSAGTLVDRSASGQTNNTTSVAGSFMGIDLGVSRTLVPNKYTLKSIDYDGGYPRNWKLQGTNFVASNSVGDWNSATWTDLDVRTADTTIAAVTTHYAFTVTGGTTGYRYLRILQTGNNSGNYFGSDLSLTMAEFEFYGQFVYPPSSASPGPLEFTGTTAGEIRTSAAVVSTSTGNQDNFSFSNGGILLMNNASAAVLRGLAAGYNGQRLAIISIGAGTVDLNHQDANSAAANRIVTTTGAAIQLAAGTGRADLVYETTNSRWRAWLR